MIGELLFKLNLLLSKHKAVFFLCLIGLIGVLGYGISRLRVTESIFATLPKGEKFEEFTQLIENKNIVNQIVFSLENDPENSGDESLEMVEVFADSLKPLAKYIKNIQSVRPDIQQDVYNFTYTHFPELIDSAYYKHINNKIQPDSVHISISSAYRQLLTPGGSFLKQFVVNDPLGITAPYFRSLNNANNSTGMTVEEGVMFSADRKQIIVTASTAYDSGNSALNVELFGKMEDFKARWNKRYPKSRMSYFGTFEIAARNAIQVKQDSAKTMTIALIAILIILIAYYRKLLIPFFLILPGIFGGIFGLGIIGFFRPEISGISLATGAVIFGILLDYAFHFFTHLRHTGSISGTVREVSAPLLTGSLTTVLAFSALQFTNSVVLQDFGLFAALSLTGAAIFTLVALPLILESLSFDYNKIPGNTKFFNIPTIPGKFKSASLVVIALLTFVFLYFARFTEFDSSLESLSMQNDDLKDREEKLTGINPDRDKRIYVFSADKLKEHAEEANQLVYQKLSRFKANETVKDFVSSGAFAIPEKTKQERRNRWESFWNPDRKIQTFNSIDRSIAGTGFNPSAFDGFKSWISGHEEDFLDETELFNQLGLDNLSVSDSLKTTLITTVTVPKNRLTYVKSELRKIQGVSIFDRGELAGSLLTLVKEDFNYILFISASIVFFTLLIVYGRIELTLLTFLPMVISWIWIFGIAAILGIKFNFVNVVITTFIFGLGDDFSIFVTDGLLNKYKTGKETLRSYQSAIVLSALTTIVGTGVLFFAEHPAIHSIAFVSVLGIVCILIVSFVVQPVIFDLFVQNRVERKKAPVTFLPFLLSISSFTYFLSGCLFLHSKLITILLLPISRRRKKAMINRSLSFYARTVIYSGPHVKKNVSGKEHLNVDKPVIFIANHTSFLDILLAIMLSPKIVLMVKGWVYNSPFFGPIIRYAGYVYTDDGPEENIQKMRALVADGYSLLVFPEGTRSQDGTIGRFHKGAFFLAEQLELDIQPLLIHGASEVLPKGDFLIRPGALNVRVLPRINFKDEKWGVQLRDKTKNISQFFKSEFAGFKSEMEDTSYLKHRIFTNYVFKGPVLEWYFKAKWQLEEKNYACYNALIDARENIMDIGCGYGYLSYYLHYCNPERKIVGVDYDDEKITIAKNGYNKTGNLHFLSADVMTLSIGSQDVIFLNDILHYLSKEKQLTLLKNCADALLNDGIIFIRDGITDQQEKHKNTERTEALSTGLFSFNKKMEDFHFFSANDIRDFARNNNLSFEMQEHSGTTSNVLFILRKCLNPA
ncbi:trifunctional MMPL family transporter/lysophospholipid acyltransferase/class I SAM-dependent methyltransferase [Dyadobacter sp. CY312]|uniref:trifunctional MMPL family transporter/lysophospholipid acyltransferase/class I SAM-dependent methyltransferase n=1 Tax=Dyadobacter sp. CY312 TaxID=2907303 RepID=UPI001F349E31|nr:trifunctional MMPL family transporter/lysophospholipid acyltransferase/class I SAM-dependent methyltransferase [Dyadobacter sp. CY312]MCE7041539.1 1-acyl-sn-glycerol-3-phosphate acyltransferase [Dyadobacter sp. CY312]